MKHLYIFGLKLFNYIKKFFKKMKNNIYSFINLLLLIINLKVIFEKFLALSNLTKT